MKILEDLKEKFSIPPGEFEGENFHFHITLAYKDVSGETFQKIKNYLKDEKINFKFKIKRLAIYLLPDPENNWFIYKIGNLL